MTSHAPPGYRTITPRLFVDSPGDFVAFLGVVFGATGEYLPGRPAEMRVGDSLILVSGTDQRDAMPACLYVYVDDVDATYERAVATGAVVLEEPRDVPYGDRRAMVRDAWANVWQIATSAPNVTVSG